jgi:anti-sigma factor RsiW
MRHRSFEKKLSAYVDNELTEVQKEMVRRHIQDCATCQRRIQEVGSIRRQIREAATVTLPDNFPFMVRSAIRREQQESVAWLGTERLARNVVVALCILVVGVIAFGSYFEERPAIGVDRYFHGEASDSAAQAVIGGQRELSKTDVMMAALTK